VVYICSLKPRRVRLTIRDDGPGLPADAAGLGAQKFGLTVMRGLARQLGALELANRPGATLTVEYSRPDDSRVDRPARG